MSTPPPNLPQGAWSLTINGKKCTAVPRTETAFLNSMLATALVPSNFSIPPTEAAPGPAAVKPPAAAPSNPAAPEVAPGSPPPADPAVVVVPPAKSSSAPPPPVQTAPPVSTVPPAPPPATTTSTTTTVAPPVPSSVPPPAPTPAPSSVPPPEPPVQPPPAPSTAPPPEPTLTPSPTVPATPQVSPSQIPAIIVPPITSQPPVSTTTTTTTTTSPTPNPSAAAAQSEISSEATATRGGAFPGAKATTTSGGHTPLATSSVGAQSITATTNHSSHFKMSMPIIGGIVGGVALIAILSFLLWFIRRRKLQRDSYLTPLSPAPGSDLSRSETFDREPRTPLAKVASHVSSKFSAVASTLSSSVSALKNKVKGLGGKDGVNMNRGNSQFMERIPQHSRQNSALSGQQSQLTRKERFVEWFERKKEDYLFRMRVKRPQKEKSPFDSFNGPSEKQTLGLSLSGPPDFSQLLAMDEQELRMEAERRRQSLPMGSPGLHYANPFSDPPLRVLNPDPVARVSNPFADSAVIVPKTPQASQPPYAGHMADVRRSRGQSISARSRYDSTYAPNRDTYGYRDTYMTSATNARRHKGRSDPFDLDSLQLSTSDQSQLSAAAADHVSHRDRRDSAATYTSKYSSHVLSAHWGLGPGPDLGSTSNLHSRSDARNN